MEDRDDYPIIPQPSKDKLMDKPTPRYIQLGYIQGVTIDSITEAAVISINGEDFIRKKVASELVSKFADEKIAPMEKELASLKEVVKELIPIAEKTAITVDDPNWEEQWEHKRKVIDRAKRISDNK